MKQYCKQDSCLDNSIKMNEDERNLTSTSDFLSLPSDVIILIGAAERSSIWQVSKELRAMLHDNLFEIIKTLEDSLFVAMGYRRFDVVAKLLKLPEKTPPKELDFIFRSYVRTLLSSSSPETQAKVSNTLEKRASDTIALDMVFDLVKLLGSPSETVQAASSRAIERIAVFHLPRFIIAEADVILPLFGLLRSPSEIVQVAAIRALEKLAMNHEYHEIIISSGEVAKLVALLSSPSTIVQEAASWAMEKLASYCRGPVGAIQKLVDLLWSKSDGVQEAASRALGKIALAKELCSLIIVSGHSTAGRLLYLSDFSSSDRVRDAATETLIELLRGRTLHPNYM